MSQPCSFLLHRARAATGEQKRNGACVAFEAKIVPYIVP